ncbi:MAG: hypothetical protein GY794_00455 [bacterium]|nr:hypothetical protein [bacterium]
MKASDNKSSYRPSAVEEYRSPERIDRAASVADAKGWIGLLVGAIVVILASAWGIWGGIPNQLVMTVEMIRKDAMVTVTADTAGKVQRTWVVPGDTVNFGDPILTISSGGRETPLKALAPGTVQGFSVSIGDSFAAGDPLATVVNEKSRGTLRAVTYVNASDAVELRGRPDTLVTPATVDTALYGRLIGVVSFVADVPASSKEMAVTLRSTLLAESLFKATGGVPYLVSITFDDPPHWSNDRNPSFQITHGTSAQAIATIGMVRPIDLLFGG